MMANGRLRALLIAVVSALMFVQPILSVAGDVTVDSGGYSVGGAVGELYNYINVDTQNAAPVIESGQMSKTCATVSLSTSSDDCPHGIAPPAVQAQNSLRGAPATGAIAPSGYPIDTVTGGVPTGAISTVPQAVNGTNKPQPAGTINTASRPFTAPASVATAPQGAAAVAAQTDNSYRAGTDPLTAVVGGGQPAGIPNNAYVGSGNGPAVARPAGATASFANAVSGAIRTTNIWGAAPIITRTINAANGNLAIDINGDGAAEAVNFLLTNGNADGDYDDGADTISISANDGDFNDGFLNNADVYTAGAGDDEVDTNAMWGNTVVFDNNAPANRYWFNIDFGGTPAAPWVTVTAIDRFFSGNGGQNPININLDDDWGLEIVYFSLTDTDSNGIYDTADLSTNNWWGEGVLNDGVLTTNNDERITGLTNLQIGITPNRYSFQVGFTVDPSDTDPDIWVTSLDWFQGALVIDTDADGAADDNVNYALGDLNSNGLYDTLELSTDDATFGETAGGSLTDDITGNNNDEFDDGEDYCQLGTYTFHHIYTQGGTYGIDQTPDGGNDFTYRSTNWYRGDWLLDSDQDGLADDTVYYVLSDTNSNGLYEQIDVSLDNTFVQGAGNDNTVAANNDETEINLAFNNLVYTSNDNLRLVYNDFRVSFANNPANANQNSDGRITANYYFGTLTVDVDANGGANDVVNFTLSDKESDGMTETIDWSTDDLSFGSGVLSDNTVGNTNDETDVGALGAGILSLTEDVKLGTYLFGCLHTYYPGQIANDVTITALEWFTGNFSVDMDGTGTARNVAFSIADTNSDGLYETVDLSSDDAQFAEDPAHTGNGALEMPGTGHDDERITGAPAVRTLLFKTYTFTMAFDNNPGYDADDIRITANEYFTNFWSVDTDGDGVLDHVNALLDDTDSNGLYETLELSMGDWEFGEGYNGNGRLRWNDDEIITAPARLYLGLYAFNLTFDLNPAGDASDTVILAQEGYLGHFNIDYNGDGLASDALYFSMADSDSEGLFEELELSMGDTVFGEGALSDGIVAAGNDELLSGTGDAQAGGITYSFSSDASPSSGTSDATLETVTVHTGSVMVEGIARNAASADLTSDGIYDAFYLDLDGDNVFGDGGSLRAGSVLADGTLALAYTIKSVDHTGTQATLVPAGSLSTQATGWMVGAISPGGVPCTVVLSDRNNDGTADNADFDTNGDGVLDDRGNTEGSLSTVTLGATTYQILVISDEAASIRMVAYTRAVLGISNDVSLGGLLRTGTLSESASGCDFNGDGDTADSLEMMMADTTVSGVYDALYLDRNGDRSFVAEQALAQGETVKLGNAVYTVERFSGDGLGASMMQTNLPLSSGKSGPEGMFGLSAPHDGLYWLKVTGGSGWGFVTYNGTNGGYGYYLMAGEVKMAASLLKGGALLSGKITDSVSGEALPGVLVELFSKTGSLVMSSISRADGTYRVAGAQDSGYGAVFTLVGYITDDGRSGGTLGSLAFSADATDKNIALKKDTSAPTLVLRKPADGEILSGMVEVAADAADNFKLARVEVSTDLGVSWAPMKGAGTNYTYLWATQSGADGQYTVAVRAVDPGGLSAYQTRTVYLGNERINPTVQFALPMDGTPYAGMIPVSVQANDAGGVRKVVVAVLSGGRVVKEMNLWKTPSSGNYDGVLDTLKLADGPLTLTATVWDMANNNANATVSVKVDNTGPVLSKFSAGSKEKVVISATFDEATGVAAAMVRIDHGSWKEMDRKTTSFTYEWKTGESDNGEHTVEIMAKDTLGNAKQYTKTFAVNNTPWSLILGVLVLVLVVVAIAAMALSGRKKNAIDAPAPEVSTPPPAAEPAPENPPVSPPAEHAHPKHHHKEGSELENIVNDLSK